MRYLAIALLFLACSSDEEMKERQKEAVKNMEKRVSEQELKCEKANAALEVARKDPNTDEASLEFKIEDSIRQHETLESYKEVLEKWKRDPYSVPKN